LRHDGRTDTTELLAAMTHAIKQNLTYVKREESGVQDPVRTLRIGSGSCRDFTVLMMEAVRSLGLAAHFVSGYLYVHQGRRVGGGPGNRSQTARISRRRRARMTSRVPMVSLERARELGDAMGMPARRTQSEAFRVLANNPGVARVAYNQLMQLLENNKFDTR